MIKINERQSPSLEKQSNIFNPSKKYSLVKKKQKNSLRLKGLEKISTLEKLILLSQQFLDWIIQKKSQKEDI